MFPQRLVSKLVGIETTDYTDIDCRPEETELSPPTFAILWPASRNQAASN